VAARKKRNLVIVESPAKAKTISKYLGPEYEVAASKGHVRDLPKTRFGIDIAKGWTPTYLILRDRKDLIASLKAQAAKAKTIYLAPDPDREGEAIAWHLKEALGLDDDRVRRVTFNEITKKAVQEAFKNPGSINMDRVQAQEARRFLDRVVGYQLSPLLSRKLARHLSAGRVQSVAVRLIVDREREIAAFQPEEYWKITATLQPPEAAAAPAKGRASVRKARKQSSQAADSEGELEDGVAAEATPQPQKPLPEGAFLAELVEWQGQKFHCKDQQTADSIVQALQGQDYVVAKVEQKDRVDRPPAPFTTSTLQQQASVRLRFSAKKTMLLAQRLYEGVELGPEGSVGLITYMRTDSVRVSEDALKEVRELIRNRFGTEYLPDKPNVYESGKAAQEGHEAIRPTDLSYTPDKVAPYLTGDLLKLYSLIYNRFVASQMTPAVFAITTVEVKAGDGLFRAQGRVLKFDGYRKVYAPAGKDEDTLLPALRENQPLRLLELTPSQHFTQPPPRYTEATLVKTLEKEGIGRPSTYAVIISKIQERGYVEQKDRRFYATPIGMLVTDLLVQHFPKIMDLKFTSHMEEELDEIESGKIARDQVLWEFYEPFQQALREAEAKMSTGQDVCPECGKPLVEKRSKGGIFYGCSGYPECRYIKKANAASSDEPPKQTEYTCPECGKPMLERKSRRGPFLACSAYPECKVVMDFDAEGKPIVTAAKTEYVCDKCGSPLLLRPGKRGTFLACSAYPKCKNALDVDAEGRPLKPIETGLSCDKCGGPMVVRKGPRGPFLGCGAYPKCRSIKPIDALSPELQEEVRRRYPPPAKKDVPQVEIKEVCPECSSPMKLRRGTQGWFLGCSKYPRCRGTRQISGELTEKLEAVGALSA